MRTEARGALPMMIVLCLAGAAVLALARWLFEVTPESLLREPTHAWWVLAWAGAIPLCAELFGGGSRSVAPGTLRPLAVRSSAVLDAKLVVLALGALGLWVWIGAVDLFLDTQMARTKLLPANYEVTVRLLLGSAALALIVTGLVAVISRSALAATVLGLLVQAVLGTLLLDPDWASTYGDQRLLAEIVGAATYYAVHPLVLCLAAIAIGWSLALRGAAKSDSVRGLGLRALGGALWAGLATATALGSSAWTTASCEPIGFDDPAARIYWFDPSPDGRQVAIDLYPPHWGSPEPESPRCMESAWILDLATGDVRLALTPGEIARHIPFGAPSSGLLGWDEEGQGLWLELAGRTPWIRTEVRVGQGSLRIRDGRAPTSAPSPSIHSDSAPVVRSRGILTKRAWQPGVEASGPEWCWVQGESFKPALMGHAPDWVLDLDGDRFLGLSWRRNTLELFDEEGGLIEVLFPPRGPQEEQR
ncbi:hypothetical protein [Planctomycetes bacterium Poly30]|uniref:hypothetical protein n=1 Tax=Saltatorellus ferox TaxID=2528018 RepID=UPI0011A0FF5E